MRGQRSNFFLTCSTQKNGAYEAPPKLPTRLRKSTSITERPKLPTRTLTMRERATSARVATGTHIAPHICHHIQGKQNISASIKRPSPLPTVNTCADRLSNIGMQQQRSRSEYSERLCHGSGVLFERTRLAKLSGNEQHRGNLQNQEHQRRCGAGDCPFFNGANAEHSTNQPQEPR